LLPNETNQPDKRIICELSAQGISLEDLDKKSGYRLSNLDNEVEGSGFRIAASQLKNEDVVAEYPNCIRTV
jgi:lambda repressor-like predicted transcriptional regulator